MNPHLAPGCRQVAFAIALPALLGGLLYGQAVSPPISGTPGAVSASVPAVSSAGSQDETVELSPFVVRGESGWNATETVAGTRLRTDLRDVPSQVETLTKDFLNDLGVTTMEDALLYSANAENFYDMTPRIDNADNPSNYLGDSLGRMRGLGQGTISSGMFDTHLQPDSYNLDSIAVASGPSAVLFGLGNPAGGFDAQVARATFRNKFGVRYSFDSENSKRASFDLNRTLISNLLSVRVLGLWSDQRTFKKPNWDRNRRFTGSLLFQPFKHTKIHLWGEKSERNVNRAPRNLPLDSVSLWLRANEIAGSPYTGAKPGYDNRLAAPVLTSTKIFGPEASQAIFIANTPTSPLYGWGRSAIVVNPSSSPAVGVPVAGFDTGVDRTINDPAVFPFDVNVYGYLKNTALGGTTRRIFLEQRLASDLHIELAYNRENSYMRVEGAGGGASGASTIFIDPNLYLPATLTGESSPRPNPNYGRYYIEYNLNANYFLYRNEDSRATLSYKLDFERRYSGWRHWLGRHQLLGYAARTDRQSRGQPGLASRILDNPVIPGQTFTAQTVANWAVNASRRLYVRAYFDSPYSIPGLPANWQQGITYYDGAGAMRTSKQGLAGLTDANGLALSTTQTPVNARWTQSDTSMGAWQGFFLPDRENRSRLVLTYGYRLDWVRAAIRSDASGLRGQTGLAPYYTETEFGPFAARQKGVNENRGVVLRPLRWLDLTYNQATTFDLSSNRFDPYGNIYPGNGGDAREYGVRFKLWNEKIDLQVVHYTNDAGPTAAPLQASVTADLINLESRIHQLNPRVEEINGNGGKGFGTTGSGLSFNDYLVTAYSAASGYEASLNLRPTSNWNIRINGSESSVTNSKMGTDWIAWMNQRMPVWTSLVATNGEVDSSGKPLTWKTALITYNGKNLTLEELYNTVIYPNYIAYYQGMEGTKAGGTRGRRVNFITSYRFTTGLLKGLSVGGAARYRGAPVLSYDIKTDARGNISLDPSKPTYGKQEHPIDLNLAYRGRAKIFGKVDYTLQVNVRNALNDRDLVPYRAYTNGTPVAYATVEPRVFQFTTAFDF